MNRTDAAISEKKQRPAVHWAKASRRALGRIYTRIRHQAKAFYYAGRRFRCPCCEHSFRRFLPYGVPLRAHARCPRCFALERHRNIWLFLRLRTNVLTDRVRLLHFAPEIALQGKLRSQPNIEYLGADLCSHRAQVHCDICRLPFPNDTFDVILCSHVLEHVPEDRCAMGELFRVMRPGGWGIFQVPLDANRKETFEDFSIVHPDDRARAFGQHDHVRVYGVDYYDRLRTAGFEVRIEHFTDDLPPEMVARHSLPTWDPLCLGFKAGHEVRTDSRSVRQQA